MSRETDKLVGIIDVMTHGEFADAMHKNDRFKSWSYQAIEALYDYLYELSVDIGEPIVFDPISLSCQYTLYEAETEEELIDELIHDFTLAEGPTLRSEENEAAYEAWLKIENPEVHAPPCDVYSLEDVIAELKESTSVIGVSDTAVIIDSYF